jgi:carbamoyltransferase
MRIGPRHPWLGTTGFRLALPLLERFYARRRIFRSSSAFARDRIGAIKQKIERGETAYLAGVSAAGTHNSGVALIEVTRSYGPRLILNNEEERFSAVKHTNEYPKLSIEAMQARMAGMGLGLERIDAWFSSWDYAAFGATLIRTLLEEASKSFNMLLREGTPLFNARDLDRGRRAARRRPKATSARRWIKARTWNRSSLARRKAPTAARCSRISWLI